MSVFLDTFKFDVIEQTICHAADFNKSIMPFVTSLDVISMKVVDLSLDFYKEQKAFHKLAETTSRLFFEVQLQIELSGAFCPKATLTESLVSKPLESLKQGRGVLKGLQQSGSVTCTQTCDKLAKLYFLTESRIKKTPYDHLLRPLDFEDLNYDLIDEKSIARFMSHLQHYNHETTKILGISCPLIDEQLANPIFFDPDPIITKLEPLEEVFRSFLWRLKVHQKELSGTVGFIPARDVEKVLKTCRYLHVFYSKVLGMTAAIERLRRKFYPLSPGTVRMSVNRSVFSLAKGYLQLLQKCHKIIFPKLEKIKSNSRYPVFTESLDKAHALVSTGIACASMHHDESFFDYFVEKCESWEETPSNIELFVEGYFWDKELGFFEQNNLDAVPSAFFKVYEQCLSSISTDEEAMKLKQDLEEVLPFLRIYSCVLKTLKPILVHLIDDAYAPKEALDLHGIIDSIKAESDKFNLLPIIDPQTSEEIAPFSVLLVDPFIKQSFEHVLAVK